MGVLLGKCRKPASRSIHRRKGSTYPADDRSVHFACHQSQSRRRRGSSSWIVVDDDFKNIRLKNAETHLSASKLVPLRRLYNDGFLLERIILT